MNKVPREMGANKIATGHHGDDFLVFFFKNIMGGNIEWIAKFTPLLKSSGKSIARIRPLFFVGNEDNEKFCNAVELPYIREELCPYINFKRKIDKSRKKWFEIINQIQKKKPDFRERMVDGIAKLAKRIYSSLEKPRECKLCGEPTNAEICGFCKLIEMSKNKK